MSERDHTSLSDNICWTAQDFYLMTLNIWSLQPIYVLTYIFTIFKLKNFQPPCIYGFTVLYLVSVIRIHNKKMTTSYYMTTFVSIYPDRQEEYKDIESVWEMCDPVTTKFYMINQNVCSFWSFLWKRFNTFTKYILIYLYNTYKTFV